MVTRRINTVGHLAQLLDARPDRLEDIARNNGALYAPFTQWRAGKRREIDRPLAPLKDVQSKIYRLLLREYVFPPYVHGGVPGSSIFKAVLPHLKQPVVVTADLRDFYPSIRQSDVWDVFRKELGCARDVAKLLTRLTTKPGGGIPQGAPTSMALANLIMAPADLQIALKTSLLGRQIRYTRWVDDLIFSGPLSDPRVLFDIVAEAVRPLGLKVHRRKSKRRIMRRHQQQSALGLVLNDGPTISRAYRRQLRAAVFNAKGRGKSAVASVLGRIEFVKNCHPDYAAKLLTSLTRVAERAAPRVALCSRDNGRRSANARS